jgi:hypothetical protein
MSCCRRWTCQNASVAPGIRRGIRQASVVALPDPPILKTDFKLNDRLKVSDRENGRAIRSLKQTEWKKVDQRMASDGTWGSIALTSIWHTGSHAGFRAFIERRLNSEINEGTTGEH